MSEHHPGARTRALRGRRGRTRSPRAAGAAVSCAVPPRCGGRGRWSAARCASCPWSRAVHIQLVPVTPCVRRSPSWSSSSIGPRGGGRWKASVEVARRRRPETVSAGMPTRRPCRQEGCRNSPRCVAGRAIIRCGPTLTSKDLAASASHLGARVRQAASAGLHLHGVRGGTGVAEVIEEQDLGEGGVKELLLTVEWRGPLHVVVVVDDIRAEERVVTVYEPDADRWSSDYRRRR